MKSKSPSRSELQAALEDLLSMEKPDIVPEGWLTVDEWAAHMNLEASTISKRLRKRVKNKTWDSRKFRIMTPRGVFPTPHYRMASAK